MFSFSRCKIFPFFLLVLLGAGTRLLVQAEPSEYVIYNGPSSKRIDIVVMGDGYTTAEIPKYRADVQQSMQGFFDQEPYREYKLYFNVIVVDVVSSQSGADHPERGSFVNTALDATYNCFNIQRSICISQSKAFAVLNRSVTPDQTDIKLVIVNDPEYGGTGEVFAISSANVMTTEIILHEIGHTFAFLGDEYGGGTDCPEHEPGVPNATKATTLATIKWNYWIDPSTPIPTWTADPGIPGLYEGAVYCEHGVYRPTYNSKMRSLYQPFEQINTEWIIIFIYNTVSPIDTTNPSASNINLQQGQNQMFSVTRQVPLTHSLDVTWFIDGQAQGAAPTFLLDSSALNAGLHTVDVLVKDNTPAVRRDPLQVISETRRWNVTIEATSTPTPTPTPTPSPPVIITEANSNRAIAFDSVLFIRDPFPKTAPLVFSLNHTEPDDRTRIMIFAHNVQLLGGEPPSVVTAQIELGLVAHPGLVEYVGSLARTPGITMVVIKLPDAITTQTDAQVSITLRGLTSNKAIVSLRPP